MPFAQPLSFQLLQILVHNQTNIWTLGTLARGSVYPPFSASYTVSSSVPCVLNGFFGNAPSLSTESFLRYVSNLRRPLTPWPLTPDTQAAISLNQTVAWFWLAVTTLPPIPPLASTHSPSLISTQKQTHTCLLLTIRLMYVEHCELKTPQWGTSHTS